MMIQSPVRGAIYGSLKKHVGIRLMAIFRNIQSLNDKTHKKRPFRPLKSVAGRAKSTRPKVGR